MQFITSPDLCEHITVWCELNQSVVNTPSTSGRVVCQPVSTLKADILNITYDCYSQNNNVKMKTL